QLAFDPDVLVRGARNGGETDPGELVRVEPNRRRTVGERGGADESERDERQTMTDRAHRELPFGVVVKLGLYRAPHLRSQQVVEPGPATSAPGVDAAQSRSRARDFAVSLETTVS